jgi:hypothetical protein
VSSYGALEIAIRDADLQGVKVFAMAGKSLEGEVAWESDPPATPVTSPFRFVLAPLFGGGSARFGQSTIPGTFTVAGVIDADYAVHTFFDSAGVYVKDVTYAGVSVMNEIMRVGTAMGAGLRVVMAHDGAILNVQVNDKDGNPGADLRVYIFPTDVPSEGVLSARLKPGLTNQAGQYTSPTLPPGKYYVAATDESVDQTPESIARLWNARNRFQEVDLSPNGSAQVRLVF